MKRIIALMLCFCFVFALCGCKDKKEKTEEEKIDLEYFVRLGKIPECQYNLGTNITEITRNKDGSLKGLEVFRYGEHNAVAVDNVNYCFDDYEDIETATVNYIISFNGAYGFSPNEQESVIVDKLAKSDLKAGEVDLSEEETFFMPIKKNLKGIKYTYGDYTTCFIFNNGLLCACTIY